jgi:hypothetical protein
MLQSVWLIRGENQAFLICVSREVNCRDKLERGDFRQVIGV